MIALLAAVAISATSARAIEHLRPFAMWAAFPPSDYYDRSVALGLAAGRRSRFSLR